MHRHDPSRHAEVAGIMARMAAGDPAAVFTLYERFATPLAGVMRGHLARMGVRTIERDDLDGLVIEACLALRAVAAAWDPAGGAKPWTWAERRLSAVARSFVGQHADPLDGPRAARADWVRFQRAPAGDASSEPAAPAPVLLATIVASHEQAALLQAALREARVSARDTELLLEHAVQAAEGDRSPATTLARAAGMSSDAVRQAVARAKRKLRALAAGSERYAPLADLPLLA